MGAEIEVHNKQLPRGSSNYTELESHIEILKTR